MIDVSQIRALADMLDQLPPTAKVHGPPMIHIFCNTLADFVACRRVFGDPPSEIKGEYIECVCRGPGGLPVHVLILAYNIGVKQGEPIAVSKDGYSILPDTAAAIGLNQKS